MFNAAEIIQRRKDLWVENQNIQLDKEYVNCIAEFLCDATNPNSELLRKEIKLNPELLIEMVFVIVEKGDNSQEDARTVPFFLNKVQKSFVDDLNIAIEQYKAGLRNFLKFIILKGRQQGFTSFITAYQLARCITSQNFSGYTLADNSGNSQDIFNKKAKFPYDSLPELLKPTEKYNTKNDLFFSGLNSSWKIGTAEAKETGRSKTINFFHGSESAFWISISSILAGLGEAITKSSIQILETTGNGYNEFKTIWDEAVKGENNWEPKFYEWWLTPEYRLNFETHEIEEKFKEQVENEVNDFFKTLNSLRIYQGLDWNQLYWYENKRKDKKELLPQEYPCTPQEAFVSTGRKYFDASKIKNMLIIASSKKKLESKDFAHLDHPYSKLFDPPLRDGMTIYDYPRVGKHYIFGADVSEGLDNDASHCKLFDYETMREVAHIHGQFSPDLFGELIVKYAKLYNNAFGAVERNNHGHLTLATIYKYLGYKNIYKEMVLDKTKEKETLKLGWLTTENSKYLMLDELDTAIRDELIEIYDEECLNELFSVVTDKDGKVKINGKDRTAASAIAYQMRKFYKIKKINFDVF